MRLYPSLTAVNGGLALLTDYDAGLVADLKDQIPATARRWDNDSRRWIIDAAYGQTIRAIVLKFFNVEIDIPSVAAPSASTELRTIRLDYLGRTKERGAGTRTAFGHVNGSWSVVFAEHILKDWFGEAAPEEPTVADRPQTLYQVLGIKKTADQATIKTAYRRMVRQWHPDVCRESDASERFQRIQAAYETLGDDRKRRKYDVGMALEGPIQRREQQRSRDRKRFFEELALVGYRSPLRCGMLMVEGQEVIGQFVVSKIHRWEDVIRDDGKTMVSSWPLDATTFMVDWV